MTNYSSKSKVIIVTNKDKLEAEEMHFLRKTYRTSILYHIRNDDTRHRTHIIILIAEISQRRQLQWYGYVRQMQDDQKGFSTIISQRERGTPGAHGTRKPKE